MDEKGRPAGGFLIAGKIQFVVIPSKARDPGSLR
jgi:hypothetical protein